MCPCTELSVISVVHVPFTTAGVPTTYIIISLVEQPTDGNGDTCTYRAPKFKCSDERRAKKVGAGTIS